MWNMGVNPITKKEIKFLFISGLHGNTLNGTWRKLDFRGPTLFSILVKEGQWLGKAALKRRG